MGRAGIGERMCVAMFDLLISGFDLLNDVVTCHIFHFAVTVTIFLQVFGDYLIRFAFYCLLLSLVFRLS